MTEAEATERFRTGPLKEAVEKFRTAKGLLKDCGLPSDVIDAALKPLWGYVHDVLTEKPWARR